MIAGRLRRLVTIQRPTSTYNSAHGPITVWVDVAEVWAEVKSGLTHERLIATVDQVQSRAVYQITIRWRGDVKVQMRVVSRGQVFEIEGLVDPDDRSRRLRLDCREDLSAAGCA